MTSLTEVLQQSDRRRRVVSDANVVLEEEVASKGGVSGFAVKAAFGMVKTLKPGIIVEVIEGLLPDFAKALDPIIAQQPEGKGLAPYLESRTSDVVAALLSVTDERAKKTTHQTLLKAYQKLRPTAEKHVGAAVPRVAKLIDKHVGEAAKAAAVAGPPAV